MTKSTKSNAVWFSRHQPTKDQLDQISSMGFELLGVNEGVVLGSHPIGDWDDLGFVGGAIQILIGKFGAKAVFGVFPTPILGALYSGGVLAHKHKLKALPLYAAWNVSRSAVRGKPTFDHFAWMRVGVIPVE